MFIWNYDERNESASFSYVNKYILFHKYTRNILELRRKIIPEMMLEELYTDSKKIRKISFIIYFSNIYIRIPYTPHTLCILIYTRTHFAYLHVWENFHSFQFNEKLIVRKFVEYFLSIVYWMDNIWFSASTKTEMNNVGYTLDTQFQGEGHNHATSLRGKPNLSFPAL